jgi:hypothetical protein
MNFIQGRCVAKPEDLHLVAELLEGLNSCARRAFSKSLGLGLEPKGLTEAWALNNGAHVEAGPGGADIGFTSSQKGMVARHAKNLRTTANARAKYLAAHYAELADACGKAVDRKQKQIKALKSECSPSNASLLKPHALKAKRAQIAKLKFSLYQTRCRTERLQSQAKRNKALAGSALATICFGSRKLASAVHRLGGEASAYPSKDSWKKAWDEARDQAWLFEGDKSAKGANENVKWDASRKGFENQADGCPSLEENGRVGRGKGHDARRASRPRKASQPQDGVPIFGAWPGLQRSGPKAFGIFRRPEPQKAQARQQRETRHGHQALRAADKLAALD